MAQHPLEPLTAEEFRQTAALLRRAGHVNDGFRFTSIELKEPLKADVKAWRPGHPVRRTSFAVVLDRTENRTYEATVDLTDDTVLSFEHIPGVTPNFTMDEFHDIDHAMRKHPDVIAALAERGFSDMSLILIDVWTYGKALMPEEHRHRRLGWCDLWARETPEGNPFGHPVSGLKLLVDVNTLELLEIERHHDYGHPEVDSSTFLGTGHPGAHRSQTAAHHAARGHVLHGGGHRTEVAELDHAAGLQLSRGPCPVPGDVRRPGYATGCRVSNVLGGDGRSLPRPHLRPLPAHRV